MVFATERFNCIAENCRTAKYESVETAWDLFILKKAPLALRREMYKNDFLSINNTGKINQDKTRCKRIYLSIEILAAAKVIFSCEELVVSSTLQCFELGKSQLEGDGKQWL